jgi:hypothetical protein
MQQTIKVKGEDFNMGIRSHLHFVVSVDMPIV